MDSAPDSLSAQLLAWYDRNARVMPWRVSPQDRASGIRPDPYRVWLSEVMLQQTTVAAVRDYFHRFTARWPRVADLAAAQDADVMGEWAGLGYYARARNLLKCARVIVADHGGRFPATREGLLALPGIGPYTASAIAAIAHDEPATVVDGNVERVISRLHLVETPLPAAKSELTRLASRLTPRARPGDYAQAIMDLGATICTPRSPACGICPWSHACRARAEGVQADLPRKVPKPDKPTRRGTLWLGHRDGAILLERRPDAGLLGGMLGIPGDGWDGQGGGAPAEARWQEIGEVRHTFTHFHLILTVHTGHLDGPPSRGDLVPRHSFRPADLPTVMRKAWDLARHGLEQPSLPRGLGTA
ncbi:A/G-specific adenine glycosylase [Tabrizicola sp.]|uniref:A/G-specific adenine glycosylase n=1 Tax=Tabrizicola sp. TaxID=2005166 RepID=UPI0027361908|nr:A/G-specific adenine glycosylase [Tabrizicola sp.]MDP3193871.1 A/G-specific adenine glycosylase [Tabrizicola sp.]MDZ4065253.1 A/G-specific adenine glycosylase [Tabrizicola sp.]